MSKFAKPKSEEAKKLRELLSFMLYYDLPIQELIDINENFRTIIFRDSEAIEKTRSIIAEDNQLLEIKKEIYKVKTELNEIKSYIFRREDKKDESLLYYKSAIMNIPNIFSVYCKQEADTVKLMTTISKENSFETLSKIVHIQIDMDNKYPNIYFDFDVKPIDDETQIDTTDWSPLYRRE